MANPAMAGPIVASPDPWHLAVTPFFGQLYVSGAASIRGLAQTDPIRPGPERNFMGDISNAQATLQTTEGIFQFFLEPGIYSLPTVGVPYSATKMSTTNNFFTGLPVAWGKIAPTDYFNIQSGKRPTLISAESMFTFQTMNIQRDLLWNQEPIVSRGVQANLTTGPVASALSGNDGYYSGRCNWISASAA